MVAALTVLSGYPSTTHPKGNPNMKSELLHLAHGRNVRFQRARLASLLSERGGWHTSNRTMRGETGPVDSYGRIDHAARALVAAASYVVYSYATPIAWWSDLHGSWVVDTTTHTITTTRQRGYLRVALAAIGEPVLLFDPTTGELVRDCSHGTDFMVTCGVCGLEWCERCDPAPAAMCHRCNGRGYALPAATLVSEVAS